MTDGIKRITKIYYSDSKENLYPIAHLWHKIEWNGMMREELTRYKIFWSIYLLSPKYKHLTIPVKPQIQVPVEIFCLNSVIYFDDIGVA